MGGARSTHEEDEKWGQTFIWKAGSWNKSDHSEDLGIDGMRIRTWMLRK